MDDLSEKLAGLLNDPESMNRVRQMAENLLGNKSEENPPNTMSSPEFSDMPSGEELKSIMSIMSHLKASGGDSKVQLIMALRPHLSEARREKADTAIKILKLLEILPYIKESGLLKL